MEALIKMIIDLFGGLLAGFAGKSIGINQEHREKIKKMTGVDLLRALVTDFGGIWNEKLNIVGFRNEMVPDTWNDWIYIHYNPRTAENQKDYLYKFKATVDPSVFYTEKPLNEKGCAHVCLGHHAKCWKFGKHNNKYEALIQTGNPIIIWRDKNKDFLDNDGIIELKKDSIHLHHGYSTQGGVDRHGAGCQVILLITAFHFAMKLFKDSGLKIFSYTLADISAMDDRIDSDSIYVDLAFCQKNGIL